MKGLQTLSNPSLPTRAGKTDYEELVAQVIRRGGPRYDPKDMRYLFTRPNGAMLIRIPLKPDPLTGARRTRDKQKQMTHREAWFVRNEMILELYNNPETEDNEIDSNITVGELITKYIDIVAAARTKRGTIKGYRADANTRLIPTFGAIKATKFKAEMYEAKLAEWLVSGKCQTLRGGERIELGTGLSKGTCDKFTRLMKMVFKHAFEVWHVPGMKFNPMAGIQPFNELKQRKGLYDFPELSRLYTAAQERVKSKRVYRLIFLTTFTGARKGELFGLAWPRVNLEECWFEVAEIVGQDEDGVYIGDTPKNGASQRKIFWNKGDYVDQMFHEMHQEHLEIKMKTRTTYDKEKLQLVFADHLGNPFKPASFNSSYNKAVTRAGLHHITFHDLRHTFSTLARSHQVRAHMDDIDQRLGHRKDINGHRMTLHYAQQDILNDRELQRLYQEAFDRSTKASVAA